MRAESNDQISDNSNIRELLQSKENKARETLSEKCRYIEMEKRGHVYLKHSEGKKKLSSRIKRSGALTTDSAGELHVLGHNGDSLGVDGAKVGVLEKTDHVSLRGFLEGKNGRGLETELVSVLRSDLTDESLEGELADEELGGLLETSDLSESDGTGSESVGFLDAVGGRLSLLSSSLVSDVLSWVLGAGVLASSLLSAGHFD